MNREKGIHKQVKTFFALKRMKANKGGMTEESNLDAYKYIIPS